MLPRLAIILLSALVLILAGCSYLKYPNVHKLTITQGNIIDQQMVDQLRPGLSRSQVRYILGTPLIADTFDQSRWDYFFSIKRPGQDELRERISIYFSDDKLAYFTGDYRPTNLNVASESAGTQSPSTSGQTPEVHSIEPSAIEASVIEPGPEAPVPEAPVPEVSGQ